MGLRSLTFLRKGLVVLLLFAAGGAASPSLTTAGGADDPGYTGGGSHPHGDPHSTLTPAPIPPPGVPHVQPIKSRRSNSLLQPLRGWLLTIFGGFLR